MVDLLTNVNQIICYARISWLKYSDLILPHVSLQLVLEGGVALLLPNSHVNRIGYHQDLSLCRGLLPGGVFRSLGYAAVPTLLHLILLQAVGLKKGFEEGYCLFGEWDEIREFYAPHVIFLGVLIALHLGQSDVLRGGVVDGPEGPEEVLVVVVVREFVLDAPEGGRRTQLIPLKAFRCVRLLGEDDGTPASAAAGLFFLKRLCRTPLTPPLDFLLGDALYDLALVEERKALPLLLPRGADQGFDRALLGHRCQFNLLSTHQATKSISNPTTPSLHIIPEDGLGEGQWQYMDAWGWECSLLIIKRMNRCHSCRNTRRQLLMLKCSHDTCIKCAADNYFINCKNKPSSKKPNNTPYYCEKCLEHTELDPNTIDTLRKYFMDNVALDQNHKNGRREKIAERQQEERQRMERVAKLDRDQTQRPKSLEIEIAERKRTLSKYLNQKQVDKFIEMQNEYGRNRPDPKPNKPERTNQQPAVTPQGHIKQQLQSNEYQLTRVEAERRREHRERRSINDSFEQFAEQQRLSTHHDYMRADPAKPRNSQRAIPTDPQELEYEIYHNGKGVAMPHLRVDRLLEEGRTSSRPSSHSSTKPVGTIRSKRSPNSPAPPSPSPPVTGTLVRRQRVASCKSEDNLDQMALRNPVKLVSTEYNTRQAEITQDAWELESKSTRRQEKTLQHPERHSLDTATVEKILQTFEASSNRCPETLQRIKESVLELPRVEVYFCKIHEDEEIIYFCLKCNQLICSECALHGSHRSHEIHSLKKSALLLRQRLAHNTGTLSKLLIQEEGKEKLLRECLQEIGVECARQKEQVRSSFENFIFHVDKKYKELLREVEDRFANILNEYTDRLNECRNNHLQVSRVKDSVCDTLQACLGTEDGTVSETSIGAACNQLGNFHVKRPRTRPSASPNSIDCINRLTSSIRELEEFLKSSNVLLFSSKKESLLSENSSLRLSESSNLLEDGKDGHTPDTNTPQGQSLFKRATPVKKIGVSSYSLNVKSRVKISLCDCIVESLLEMQDIVKAIKLDTMEYQLRALQ